MWIDFAHLPGGLPNSHLQHHSHCRTGRAYLAAASLMASPPPIAAAVRQVASSEIRVALPRSKPRVFSSL